MEQPVQPPPPKRQRRESSPVIYCHDDCARHVTTGDGDAEHQESPARLAAIAAALQNYARRRDFAPASREALLRVHSARYLDAVSSIETRGRLSPMLRTRVLGESGVDAAAGATPVGPGTWTAATRAAGAALAAVRDATPGSRAFVLVRPPGHHAMREGYDASAGGCGFCVLGNAAVAAAEALTSEEKRVAVVDFDVHHGNGTEAWASTHSESRLLYASVHLREVYPGNSHLDFFPGTGAASCGCCFIGTSMTQGPDGNNIIAKPCIVPQTTQSTSSVPVTPNWIQPGARERFVSAVTGPIADQLRAFRPSLLIISAGFDALEGDAGQLNPWMADDPDLPSNVDSEVLDGVGLRPEDYGTMTRALINAVTREASVVSLLEGGYGRPDGAGGFEKSGLVAAAVAHVEALELYARS